MAYTTINKSTDYFNTKTYSGSGSAQNIVTGTFQPDLIWVKSRSNAVSHVLTDAVRGIGKQIFSDTTGAETSWTNALTAFRSDGFTTDTGGETGQSGRTYVAWNWKANGQGSSNTDGSINTTYTSVNTTAGFSISTYTGNGTNNATIGHGLGAVPKMMIFKILSSADDWTVYHASLGATKKIDLNSTGAESTVPEIFNDTEPTSSLITFGTHGRTNTNGQNYIAYCFAEKTGYSKFGSYVGNGNADGTFVYTGFKPAFIMYKKSSGTGRWTMEDNKRDPFNVATHGLAANGSSAENTGSNYWDVDLLSNGFKFRTTEQETNQSGQTFIYMAFGAAPLVGSNNVPCTAR